MFNGNNYSEEWSAQAAALGLPIARLGIDALNFYDDSRNIHLFEQMQILSPLETVARTIVLRETFLKSITLEVRTLRDMVQSMILPAVIKFQGQLATSYTAAFAALGDTPSLRSDSILFSCLSVMFSCSCCVALFFCSTQKMQLSHIVDLIGSLNQTVAALPDEPRLPAEASTEDTAAALTHSNAALARKSWLCAQNFTGSAPLHRCRTHHR